MSDKEKSQSNQDNFNEEEKNNDLLNTINILDEEFKNNNQSTIDNQENQISSINNSIINLNKEIKENNLPYLNEDKIKEINIKNENHLDSGIKIEDYIQTPINNNFNDNIYNLCENCKKNHNNIFCKNCQKNICYNCFKDCENNFHEFIELQTLNDEIEYYKTEIKRIKEDYFIKPEKKEKNNEKESKSYEAIDENKIINENNTEKNIIYTNDILLIDRLVQKNYNNYFHYKNIKNSYIYMEKRYDNYIIIEYKIKNNDKKIKLFSKNFVINNRKKCQIIIGENEFELMECFELKNYVNNNILKIKLIGINNIINMKYMFAGCDSLKSFPDISRWNTSNVINMEGIFYMCNSLESLPDISKWNTSNVINMNNMFYGCSSLKSLPDISKWNTSNVTHMNLIFYGCRSLKSLPDISKWNTSNVINMRSMFFCCNSLQSLPDILKWDICKVTNIEYMF